MLTHIVVLHLLIRLVGKTALNRTPLVVGLLHILPINPGFGLDVSHIVKEALSQCEVSANTVATRTCLAHPQWHLRLMSQQCQTGTVGIIA